MKSRMDSVEVLCNVAAMVTMLRESELFQMTAHPQSRKVTTGPVNEVDETQRADASLATH